MEDQALLDELIAPWARKTPDAPAVTSQGRTCCYALFATDIGRCIARLATENLPSGARVLIETPDLYMFWALALACEALGLSFCAAPPGGAQESLLALLTPALRVTTSPDDVPGVLTLRIDADFVADLAGRSPASAPKLARSGDDEVCVLATSGTTGEIKAISLTRAMLTARNRHFRLASGREWPSRTRGLSMAGPWSIAGVLTALHVWPLGGCLCAADGPNNWNARLRILDLDYILLAPVHLQQLLADARGWRPMRDFGVFIIGGTPSATLVEQARVALSCDVWVTYGATEAGVVASAHIEELAADRAVAGRLHPWVDAQVLDGRGAPVGVGEVGELRLQVEGMARGHIGEDEGTPGALFAGGWFRPGDMASIDVDRVLRIHGRTDDLLHLGGAKVLPSVLERAVEPLPGVAECAAFSAPDADGLETPYVAVAASEAFDPAAAVQALVTSLGRAVRLVRVDVLPRNALGKVERTKLRAVMMERAARRSADDA